MAKCYASTIIAYVKTQVGVKETGTNINKYAADIDKNYPDFYNGKKQGAQWCDVFFDDSMIHCFGEANALRLTCQPKHSCGAGCKYSYGYYKAKGQVGKKPKLGAQIFFGATESTISHTGIVVKISDTKVYTIEGNKNNKVSECSYSLKDSKIFGYGYPTYDPEPKEEEKKEETEKKSDSSSSAAKTTSYKVNAKSGLNLRKSASTSSSVICVMPNGSTFKVDKVSGDWAHGTYNGKTGYANTKWLKKG